MIHGILNVRKEKGFTSHDVVAKLRGMTRQKKIGHTGTLDPDAEGVLPVCLGKATKLCERMTDKEKVYEAVMVLGKETDTQDLSGTVLKTGETDRLTEEEVRRAVHSFEGSYDQIPPMYSAVKVGGKKLYELAREGKEIERKPRRVEIRSIRILEMKLPEVKFEVVCSKGTYIRTLCSDIGQALGCGACMGSLLRTTLRNIYAGGQPYPFRDRHVSQRGTDRRDPDSGRRHVSGGAEGFRQTGTGKSSLQWQRPCAGSAGGNAQPGRRGGDPGLRTGPELPGPVPV